MENSLEDNTFLKIINMKPNIFITLSENVITKNL
uniref:Uncharacterized protein n=1 Tax=Leptosiphonia brodiei TaxID=2608611 RepID=A0A1Z1MAP0_9FLOR|nr:hypothetical protein [Leptosiphonia brodiei]ARW62983.1 hypothetical protein [Leptosiphonia brodiei]